MNNINQARPDTVVIAEFTPDWADQLAVLGELYPHLILAPALHAFGIALYSRHPLEDAEIFAVQSSGLKSVRASLVQSHQRIRIIGTHPLPPVGRANAGSRNAHLNEIAQLARRSGEPVILLGDFNIAPGLPTSESSAGRRESTTPRCSSSIQHGAASIHSSGQRLTTFLHHQNYIPFLTPLDRTSVLTIVQFWQNYQPFEAPQSEGLQPPPPDDLQVPVHLDKFNRSKI